MKRLFLSLLLFGTPALHASLSCPQPYDFKWVMPTAAILGVGGGAIAGYGRATHRERTRTTKEAEVILDRGSREVRSLEWIAPSNNSPSNGPLIHAEIFSPDDSIYAQVDMGRGKRLISILPLGEGETTPLKGQYRVVFTVEEEGDNPSDLGGIAFNDIPILTQKQNFLGPKIPIGVQEVLIVDYPSGPYQ